MRERARNRDRERRRGGKGENVQTPQSLEGPIETTRGHGKQTNSKLPSNSKSFPCMEALNPFKVLIGYEFGTSSEPTGPPVPAADATTSSRPCGRCQSSGRQVDTKKGVPSVSMPPCSLHLLLVAPLASCRVVYFFFNMRPGIMQTSHYI